MTHAPDFALALLRAYLGFFFLTAGYRKLTETRLPWKLMCARLGLPDVLRRFMPYSQVAGGLALLAGFLSPLAAGGLIAQMIGAFFLTTYPDLCEVHPRKTSSGFIMNAMQSPEALIAVALVVVAILGGGAWSIDFLLFGKP